MPSVLRRIFEAVICLVPLLWASCVTMSFPGLKAGPASYSVDKNLISTWELLYQINDKGEKETVGPDKPRTLIEFTDKGRVIFNKIFRDNPDSLTSHQGTYTVDKGFLSITDHKGRTSRWPYEVAGETLITSMPERKEKFYWRRTR